MARPKKYPANHKFVRNCPECKVEIEYGTSSQFFQAERLNRKCRKCGCGHFKGKTKDTCDALKKSGLKNSILRKGKPTWNKGLTKDTHPSLIVIGKKRKGIKHSASVLEKISEASTKHWTDKRYRKLVSDKVKEVRGNSEVVARWRQTGEMNGKFTPLEQKSKWDRYTRLVWNHTNRNDLSVLENFNLRGRVDIDNDAYHLDHIVSITDGFNNGIPAEIIGSIHNLRFIPAYDNMNKKQRSDMTLEVLLELYYGDKNGISKDKVS